MPHRTWQGGHFGQQCLSQPQGGTGIPERCKQLHPTRGQRRGMHWSISGKPLLYSMSCVPPELSGKEGLSRTQSDSGPEFPTRGGLRQCSNRYGPGVWSGSVFKVPFLVDLVVQCGRGCAMFKRDLKRAYRQIPIDPGDIHVLGYKWDNKLYFDTALPMGLKISCTVLSTGDQLHQAHSGGQRGQYSQLPGWLRGGCRLGAGWEELPPTRGGLDPGWPGRRSGEEVSTNKANVVFGNMVWLWQAHRLNRQWHACGAATALRWLACQRQMFQKTARKLVRKTKVRSFLC